MSSTPTPTPTTDSPATRNTFATLDVVVPVYNEEADLERSIRALHTYLRHRIPWPSRIVIADNASTDATAEIADRLVSELDRVQAIHLAEKGRGRALKRAWLASDADVVAYMDVDLSTDLNALLPLVAPLFSGHSDIAIGSRLSASSRVVRGPKRGFISRSYNLLLQATLGVRFSDAQCGFKAMRTDTARRLLPLVEDNAWFFDTESLILAERAGLRIHEVPVDWDDDPDSRVHIVSTALEDLRGMWRVGMGLLTGRIPLDRIRRPGEDDSVATPPGRPLLAQVTSFAVVGVASTLAFALLYLLLRPAMGAQWANLLALVVTAVANTAANRHLTFNSRSRGTVVRDQVSGLLLMLLALALTSGSLALLHHFAPGSGHITEVAVLTGANVLATLIRFVGLRAVMSR